MEARAKFALLAKKRAQKGEYSLSVTLGGIIFNAKTDDIKTALLDLKPEKITNTVTVAVTKGAKTIEKKLTALKARQIFFNGLACQYFTKNLTALLN